MIRITVCLAAILLVGCSASEHTTNDSIPAQACADVYYVQGARQFKLQNWSTALASYKKALKENPDDSRGPEAMYYIGLCHQELGNKQEAIAAYRAFIKKYPPHPDAAKARANLSKKFGASLSQPESDEPDKPGQDTDP